MKSLKKAGIFLLIAVVLTVLLPATALASVTGNNINTVSSKLGHLTSSNPSEGWAWGETRCAAMQRHYLLKQVLRCRQTLSFGESTIILKRIGCDY